jgi:hypothetical protein
MSPPFAWGRYVWPLFHGWMGELDKRLAEQAAASTTGPGSGAATEGAARDEGCGEAGGFWTLERVHRFLKTFGALLPCPACSQHFSMELGRVFDLPAGRGPVRAHGAAARSSPEAAKASPEATAASTGAAGAAGVADPAPLAYASYLDWTVDLRQRIAVRVRGPADAAKLRRSREQCLPSRLDAAYLEHAWQGMMILAFHYPAAPTKEYQADIDWFVRAMARVFPGQPHAKAGGGRWETVLDEAAAAPPSLLVVRVNASSGKRSSETQWCATQPRFAEVVWRLRKEAQFEPAMSPRTLPELRQAWDEEVTRLVIEYHRAHNIPMRPNAQAQAAADAAAGKAPLQVLVPPPELLTAVPPAAPGQSRSIARTPAVLPSQQPGAGSVERLLAAARGPPPGPPGFNRRPPSQGPAEHLGPAASSPQQTLSQGTPPSAGEPLGEGPLPEPEAGLEVSRAEASRAKGRAAPRRNGGTGQLAGVRAKARQLKQSFLGRLGLASRGPEAPALTGVSSASGDSSASAASASSSTSTCAGDWLPGVKTWSSSPHKWLTTLFWTSIVLAVLVLVLIGFAYWSLSNAQAPASAPTGPTGPGLALGASEGVLPSGGVRINAADAAPSAPPAPSKEGATGRPVLTVAPGSSYRVPEELGEVTVTSLPASAQQSPITAQMIADREQVAAAQAQAQEGGAAIQPWPFRGGAARPPSHPDAAHPRPPSHLDVHPRTGLDPGPFWPGVARIDERLAFPFWRGQESHRQLPSPIVAW